MKYPPTSAQPDPINPAEFAPFFMRLACHCWVAGMPPEGRQETFETLVSLFKFYSKQEPTGAGEKEPNDE